MISKKLLHPETMLTSIRTAENSGLTINSMKMKVERACADYGLNVIVSVDTVVSGRMFDNSKSDCITITNAEHQTDYFKEVIVMKRQGKYAFFDFYYTGTSKNNRRVAEGKREHSTVMGSLIGAIKKATVSDDAMETETNYYVMLCDALQSIFN